MNRRSFLSSMLKGAIACAILPSAITYERKWKQLESGLVVPIADIERFTQLPFYLVKYESHLDERILKFHGMKYMNEQSQPTPPAEENDKIKCEICNALLARVFIDLGGKRIHLCNQDAFTMLRLACINEPDAMTRVHKFVNEQIYGNEV